MSLSFTLIRAIHTKEWQQAKGGMTFWLGLAMADFTLMALVFFASRFFDVGSADMVLVFGWFPFVAALFLPVLGAGMVARDRERGTDRLLRGTTVKSASIFGKWTALFSQSIFLLVLQFPFLVMLLWLGSPDMGMILSGSLGAILVLASFSAGIVLVGTFQASTSLTALLGILMCLIILLPLPEGLSSLLPASQQDLLARITAQGQYHDFVRGLIRPDHVLYFLLLTALALGLAQNRQVPSPRTRILVPGLALCILAVTGLGPHLSHWSVDMTQNRQFTVPTSLQKAAQDLPQERHWTLYFSAAQAAHYPRWRETGDWVRGLLARLAQASTGKLQVDTVLVLPDTAAEDAARKAGLVMQSTDNGSPMVFGLVEDGKALIPLIRPGSTGQLDLQLALALAQSETGKTGLALLDNTDLAGKDWYITGRPETVVHALLRRDFHLLPETETDAAPLMLLVHPGATQNSILANRLADDQPLAAFVLLDPWREAAARPGRNGEIRPGAHPVSAMPPALQALGLHMSQDVVFAPAMAATTRNPNTGAAEKWPLWLQIPADQFAPQGLLAAALAQPLGLASVGDLQASPGKGWTWTPLLQTGADTYLAPETAIANGAGIGQLRNELHQSGVKTLMGLLQDSARNKQVLVLADTDWLEDEYIGVHDPVSGWRPLRGNVTFLVDALHLLSTDPGLLSLRPHIPAAHPLTRVEAWRRLAQTRLDDVEAQLAQLQSDHATAEQLARKRAQLRTVRHAFAARMRWLEWGLVLPVLLLAPLGFALFGFWRNRVH